MKCKYRVRWFSSKGAFLVLLWALLVVISCSLPSHIEVAHQNSGPSRWLVAIPVMLLFVSAPLSGWLADAKFGNYKVLKIGIVLLFISAVMNCLYLTVEALGWSNSVLKWMHTCIVYNIFIVGCCVCMVTALPFGLDQMPDASSSSITSFISWFVCTIFFGRFFCKIFDLIDDPNLVLIFAFFSVLCLSIVLTSVFVFSPKWLIIEPKSPQSLKTIFHVLKFAAKHKVPLNRSAFTYWEEDIPSRIDLGKSKYGGPFTTEQVENVKTILRLLTTSIALFPVVLLINFRTHDSLSRANETVNFFIKESIHILIYNPTLYFIFTTLIFEFLVYPFAQNKLPGILMRIAAGPLILTIVSFVCVILELFHYYYSSETILKWIVQILHNSMNGIMSQVLLTSVLELMCAQSPYSMRGLLPSFLFPLILLAFVADWEISDAISYSSCSAQAWCSLMLFSVKTLTCFIGFLLFCAVARWYKMRVRDEDYSPQRVVEEVYDRYLTAATAHSKSYGSLTNYT